MAERKGCPWCSGEVVIDSAHKKIAHSYPECPAFLRALAMHPPSSRAIEVLDEKGEPVPGQKGRA